MFSLVTDTPHIFMELCDVVRLFTDEYDPAPYEIEVSLKNPRAVIRINGAVFESDLLGEASLPRRLFVRAAKNTLYRALRTHFDREVPWGSLTGIRPSKLVYEELLQGTADFEGIADKLQREFFVHADKARLITEIVRNQQGHIPREPDWVNLYIHIPFCPSRCYYCSFVSEVIDKQKGLVEPYVEKLCLELVAARELLRQSGRRVFSIYIGGGTPTVLSTEQLARVLTACAEPCAEFTCEAGRPDTITHEKIAVMKNFGVTRVSVNPQSLNDDTLKAIGRKHTEAEFYAAYGLASTAGFVINVDLIAGLVQETPDDFAATLTKVSALRPQNITVHTLSKKRGSQVKEQCMTEFSSNVSQMTAFAGRYLTDMGYIPYYLYRQKQMLDNLENVGYCLPAYPCVNNITVMEEALSVVACGAGAISKLVIPQENRIERLANIRDVKLYLERFDEQISKKQKFFT